MPFSEPSRFNSRCDLPAFVHSTIGLSEVTLRPSGSTHW